MKMISRAKLSRMAFIILLLLISIVFSYCGAGINNESKDLNDDTYFRRSGGNFSYIDSHNELHPAIFPVVISYVYDTEFVLVAQIPNRKYYAALLTSQLNTGRENYKKLELKADSILTNDPYHLKVLAGQMNFWIIQNSTHHLIGPMSLNQYLKKRKDLHVSEKLKLNLEV